MDQIILEKLDQGFKDEVAEQPGSENIMRCFTCGTCTASCPVAEVHEKYDPRKIIRMVMLGMREEVLSSDVLWMCSRCYTCHALCPQNVKFTDVISILRDMAVKEGYSPQKRLDEAKTLDNKIQSLRCKIINHKLHPDKKEAGIIKQIVDEILNEKW